MFGNKHHSTHHAAAPHEAAKAGDAAEAQATQGAAAQAQPAPQAAAPAPSAQPAATKAEADEFKNKYLRALADLDNARKRHSMEKLEHSKYANQNLLNKLLPIIDSFELALQHSDQVGDAPAAKSLVEGLKMTVNQLHSMLRESGVEAVDALGKPFDPHLHEAISQMDSEEHPAGNVMQQLRKGYRLHERLLRPATVIVSKGKPQAPAAENAAGDDKSPAAAI